MKWNEYDNLMDAVVLAKDAYHDLYLLVQEGHQNNRELYEFSDDLMWVKETLEHSLNIVNTAYNKASVTPEFVLI